MVHSFEKVKLDQVFFRYEHDYSVRQLAEMIWLVSHENIVEFLRRVPEERQCRIRFEDLVSEPKRIMERICELVGLSFQQNMLHPYKDKDQKMTDGLHGLSKMRGDPKFHLYQGIDPRVADQWKEAHANGFLGEITWRVAEPLGYRRESPARAISMPQASEAILAPRSEGIDHRQARELLTDLESLSDEQVASLLEELSDS
jgi:hypothetical protein